MASRGKNEVASLKLLFGKWVVTTTVLYLVNNYNVNISLAYDTRHH